MSTTAQATKSTPAAPKARRRELVFPRATAFLNFILTCSEDASLAPGSEMYKRSLNKVLVHKGKQTLHVVAQGPEPLVKLMEQMAAANEGQAREYKPPQDEAFQTLSIEQLVRSVRLRQEKPKKTGHLLLTLRGEDAEGLRKCVRQLWELGARAVEVAFVQRGGENLPSHCIRVTGMRHLSAFLSWAHGELNEAEVYAPADTDRSQARFYTSRGYQLPVLGLDRLCGLEGELVLVRPKDKSNAAQWLAFGAGQVNFFRKPHDVFDVEIALDEVMRAGEGVTELSEAPTKDTLSLELAVVPRARSGANQVWVLDGEIDRQRRGLQELERQRGRLASGDADEVYFAYRFDQEGMNQLNPLLARMLQRRLGVLAHHEYAFCKPKGEEGYHLVLANRTQRQLGFALQLADKVYYQPSQWRRWGVNIYLPVGTELSPRVDGPDAIPLLQQLLEKAGNASGTGDTDGKSLADYSAVLWEQSGQGQIKETRVRQTAPLLEQYRLLNSFQRSTATEVAAATRKALGDGLHAARGVLKSELDGLERELLEDFTSRTVVMERTFSTMEGQLKVATDLVKKVGPGAEKVSKLILDLPKEWVTFVNRVIDTHREISDPAVAAAAKLSNQIRRGRDELSALASRNRDLGAEARNRRDRLGKQLVEAENEVRDNTGIIHEVNDLARRAVSLLKEIATLHAKLASRIQKVETAEKKAEQMQTEIDGVGQREIQVKERLAKLKALQVETEKVLVQVQAMEAEAGLQQHRLLSKSQELASKREELREKIERPLKQLEHIEEQLLVIATRTGEVDEVFNRLGEEVQMINSHAEAVQLWEQQRRTWTDHMEGQKKDLTETLKGMARAIEECGSTDARLAKAKELTDEASKILQEI